MEADENEISKDIATCGGADPGAEVAPPGRGQNHHFAPCFYLRRWARGRQARLCEFSVQYGAVRPRWTSPRGTGYVPLLYGLGEGPAGERDRLETEFYRPVDTRAADALAAIEAGADDELEPSLRTAWSRFMMSLMMRMPADVELLTASYRVEFANLTPEQKRQWAAKRKPDWPATMTEALAQLSEDEAGDQAKELATRLMENKKITVAMSTMHWRALDVSTARNALVTSDRPLRLSGKLREERTELVLPIGPGRLFVAGYDRRRVDGIAARGADRLVARSNRAVAAAADSYGWASDAQALEFMQRHLGRSRPKSQLEQLVEYMKRKRTGTGDLPSGSAVAAAIRAVV